MNNDLRTTKDQDDQPDLDRRKLGIGLMAVLGGGLGVATAAQAFPNSSNGEFNAASRILDRYGVSVNGEFDGSIAPGHDALTIEVTQQPLTEYRQVVGTQARTGEIVPCVKTSVFGDDASFIHFHPGEIIPCIKTRIEGHTLATHELFDSDDGGIIPCIKVVSEMRDGGHLGSIVVTVNGPDENFSVLVGDRAYVLLDGALVEQESTPR